jgi:magnesium transporter
MPVRVLRSRRLPPPLQPPRPTPRLETLTYAGLRWIDIQQPSAAEMDYLRERFPFHPLDLEDCLSTVQRPKLDDYAAEGYLFIVLHFPRFNKRTRHTAMAEVDIFVGRDYIVTTHDGMLKPLAQLFLDAQGSEARRAQLMGRGAGYLFYCILDELVNYCFPIMDKIDQHTTTIESRIFDRNVRTLVEELSFVRRDIITLRRIIRPNIPVVRQLENRERAFLNLDEDVYFGDIVDHLNKQWDMLEDNRELIEGLNATLDSLTSHRINEVIKTLTIISVVLLPMTLLASIYGMNIGLPFADHGSAFLIVVGLMLTGATLMIAYFRWRDWL